MVISIRILKSPIPVGAKRGTKKTFLHVVSSQDGRTYMALYSVQGKVFFSFFHSSSATRWNSEEARTQRINHELSETFSGGSQTKSRAFHTKYSPTSDQFYLTKRNHNFYILYRGLQLISPPLTGVIRF